MALKKIILSKKTELLPPAKGRLLIAGPFVQDESFSHSVVLILDEDEGGFMGVVVNKPLDVHLGHLLLKYDLKGFPICNGGPVDEGRLFYLHNIPLISDSVRINDEIYVGGGLPQLSITLKEHSEKYAAKFLVGYAGWSREQLKSEIEEESWVVSDVNVDIFSTNEVDLWRDSLLALKDDYYSIWLNAPFDPVSN